MVGLLGQCGGLVYKRAPKGLWWALQHARQTARHAQTDASRAGAARMRAMPFPFRPPPAFNISNLTCCHHP